MSNYYDMLKRLWTVPRSIPEIAPAPPIGVVTEGLIRERDELAHALRVKALGYEALMEQHKKLVEDYDRLAESMETERRLQRSDAARDLLVQLNELRMSRNGLKGSMKRERTRAGKRVGELIEHLSVLRADLEAVTNEVRGIRK